jgi:hypothetical protein
MAKRSAAKKPSTSTATEDAQIVFARVSPAEKMRYVRQAEKDGFRNFSDWVRVNLNKAAPE